MKRSRRKVIYERKTDFLERPHEEPDIQQKALKPEKKLTFIQDNLFRKGKSAIEGDLKEALHLPGLRVRHQYSEQRSMESKLLL